MLKEMVQKCEAKKVHAELGETLETKLHSLLAEWRAERAKDGGSRSAAAELSKEIQKGVRKKIRRKKGMKLGNMLSEFRGLKHIADARNHGVQKKLGSDRDRNGDLQTDRKGVVDASADFCADLYATRGEVRGAREAVGGVEAPVREIASEEVEA